MNFFHINKDGGSRIGGGVLIGALIGFMIGSGFYVATDQLAWLFFFIVLGVLTGWSVLRYLLPRTMHRRVTGDDEDIIRRH